MHIGFIGLGTMGAHMAANAQAGGHALIVNDLNQAAATPHIKNGARWAANAREIGAQADIVLTSLRNAQGLYELKRNVRYWMSRCKKLEKPAKKK